VDVEVRYTKEKGWGVHAKEDILKGTYVATYIGEVSI
jgi:SET domain-containing protein